MHYSRILPATDQPGARPWPLGQIQCSRHAHQRRQQRAIPQAVIDGLLDFGEARRTRDGQAWRWTFGKRGWKRFAAWLGPAAAHFERYRRVYLVTAADDTLVTVAWDWR